MRLLKGLTTTTRLSIGLVLVTASALLMAEAIGLFPDERRVELGGRGRYAEAIGLQFSMDSVRENPADALVMAQTAVARHPDLMSVGVRRADGTFHVATAGHEELWGDPGEKATPTHLRMGVFDADAEWGAVELRFAEADHPGLFKPNTALVAFTLAVCFVAYRFYLRKVLQYLDPSSVIPERVKAMLDTMAEGVLVLDEKERVVMANEAFLKMSGLVFSDLQGKRASSLAWELRAGPDGEVYPWVLSQDGVARKSVEVGLRRRDGELQFFMVNVTPISAGGGKTRGMLATFDDMTALEAKNADLQRTLKRLNESRKKVQQKNQELKRLATRDTLTNCLNRRAFFEQIEQAWSASSRHGYGVCCVMVDIDHFKRINDAHGHAVGDGVLKAVADTLHASVRQEDFVCRYGGEEFCVFLPHTDLDEGLVVAEKLRAAIESTAHDDLVTTASLGVAGLASAKGEPQELINEADVALYAAKRSGRNRVVSAADAEEIEAAGQGASATPANGTGVTIPYHAVMALLSALAQRDPGTAAHCQRVASLCVRVAEHLMPVGDRFILEVAALLHDIGKIGIPDSILLKPGPLTEEEWGVMRMHDHIGVEIIGSAFQSPELINVVRHHHAHYGGKADEPGLPRGGGIPLRARILSICDAYDAMVSKRVYREARSNGEAFAELRRCAGTQFDPELVEIFIDVVSDGEAGERADASDSSGFRLHVGLEVERLVVAMESNDLAMLSAVAERLGAVATKHDSSEIAAIAQTLSGSLDCESDIEEMLERLVELTDEVAGACEGGGAMPPDSTVESDGIGSAEAA